MKIILQSALALLIFMLPQSGCSDKTEEGDKHDGGPDTGLSDAEPGDGAPLGDRIEIEPEPGSFAAPLHQQPTEPGPHIELIKALEPGHWLEIDAPAPDPKWGAATGRSWGAYAMPYAPNLGGAFMTGEGVHAGWGGVTATGWDESHPRYWYGLDDYWFYDVNQNRWICIYPGTPVKDLWAEFESGRFKIDRELGMVVMDSPEPSLPGRLDGSIVPSHLLIHAWGYVDYDTKRNQLFHFGTSKSSMRGFSSYYFPRRSVESTQQVFAYLESEGYYDEANQPSLGPVIYDVKTGKFTRSPANIEASGRAFPGYIYMRGRDKVLRISSSRSVEPRIFDPETHEWGPPLAALEQSMGWEVPYCHDTKRDRAYIGIASGTGDSSVVNDHFGYYDIENDVWVWPNPSTENEPPGVSWGQNRARMFYNEEHDQILLFYMPREASATHRIYVYNIVENRWEKPVDVPDYFADDGSNRRLMTFYDSQYCVYFIFRTGDSKDNHRLFVYRHNMCEDG